MSATPLRETSRKHTGNLPDRILIIAHSLNREEVIGEAAVPYVGLQYVEECARAFARSLPWYDRSYHVRYEVRRGRKVVCKGWLRGGPLAA
jgi:hypothetical protein